LSHDSVLEWTVIEAAKALFHAGFRLVTKSVTLNDLEWRSGLYFFIRPKRWFSQPTKSK